MYGLPFISKDNYLVSVINGAGTVIESIYVLIFLIFAPKREKIKIFGLLISIISIFSTIALLSALAFHDKARKQQLCGYAATVFSIIMYASPLSIMRMVIKSKSVEYMPFLLSLFVFLCGTSWFIYGLIGKDKFLYIPNGFGSLLGTMQLILYAIYRNNKGAVDTTKPTTDETLEMGLDKQTKPNHSHNGSS
ncbi:Bidirectional sugar transporter sweet1 [Castilleja foliolosa]|uniref:Bidirectional sugar transporter sweet1 n=1 Tax=Castilleja foliolosa TaxID=1961234 RepID=A0ABD3DB20_9LAMI